MIVNMAPESGFFNGVEFINYSQLNIVVTDQCGIGTEIGEDYDRAPSHYRGKVVVRVTKIVDPRRVTIPSKQARYPIDIQFIEEFETKVKERASQVSNLGMSNIRSMDTIQLEMAIDFNNINDVIKSHFFGFSIRAERNRTTGDVMDTATSDIKKYFIPTIEEMDRASANHDDVSKTVSAVRLIDSKQQIGDLWTTTFGTPVQILAAKESKLDDGLYITAGVDFEHVAYVPLETLDSKTLMSLNLHKTKLDAQKHSTGEYTADTMAALIKARKENRELSLKVTKVTADIDEMKAKQMLEAQKNATTISDLKNKGYTEAHKQGLAIEELKRVNNRMIDESIRTRNDHRDEVKELKRTYDRTIDELKDNKKTNVVLDVFRTVGSFLQYISGAAKLFAQLCF